MIDRFLYTGLMGSLQHFPCVVLLGPRQCGKTTLAKALGKAAGKEVVYLDLELPSDLNKLSDAEAYLRGHADKLVIMDEVQRSPEIFPLLRALIDQDRIPARFLLLGSAGPELLRESTESLAGRVSFHQLTPFLLTEVEKDYPVEKLWIRGGFPDAFLFDDNWMEWMQNFTRTYVERDLPLLGFPSGSRNAYRLWMMLAQNHGQLVNYSDLGKSLEIGHKTIKSYIDFLEKSFLIRQLQPYYVNLGKRVVKSPRIYIRDSGVLHYLLGITSPEQLYSMIKVGSSWEGFVIEQVASLLPANCLVFFYRTHDGSELDLVIEQNARLIAGIEIKIGSDSRPVRGNTLAADTLGLTRRYVVTRDSEDYLMSNGFRICSLNSFLSYYLPELLSG
ncbi:MAG: ATP-binding protein [Bacteroidetes bacterium]|nr:ATP-binding protein [Bacteroidota bacterium]